MGLRIKFEEQLELLNKEMVSLGALCEEVITLASEAMLKSDSSIATKVKPLDSEIDRKEREIENLCLTLLLQQQPVARDLRVISAALKMITDMERIGDQAEDISEIIEYLGGRIELPVAHIGDMAKAAVTMVNKSVEAFVKQDIEMAKEVIKSDDIVDDLFNMVKKSLIKMIVATPTDGEFAMDLLMIAKYYERIGDHATNIAEWVLFSVTGEHVETLEPHGAIVK